MKLKTHKTILCGLTDEEIGGKTAIVFRGKITKLDADGNETDTLVECLDADGDAILVSALIAKLRGEKKAGTGAKREKVEHATADEVVKVVKDHNGVAAQQKIAEVLGKPVHALRGALDEAVKAGRLIKPHRGVFQYVKQAQKAA